MRIIKIFAPLIFMMRDFSVLFSKKKNKKKRFEKFPLALAFLK